MSAVMSLGEWGAGLDPRGIPKPVLQRAQLQLLHIATLIDEAPADGCWTGFRKLGARRGAAYLKGGTTTSTVNSARIHASRAGWTDCLDHLLGGPTGVGAVCAAFGFAKGATLETMLAAVVVGNEVGGRIGSAMLLGPNHSVGSGWVYTTSAAASAGRMMGLGPKQMSHAIALALVAGSAVPRSVIGGEGRALAIGGFVAAGVEAARAAQVGVQGPTDILDAAGGVLDTSCWLPLRHAFSGLGTAWLTETVSFPRWPGPAVWHAALDCVNEILARHVKAADKRLRSDQVTAIHVQLPAPAVALDGWSNRHGLRVSEGLGHALRHAIGALVVEHQLGSAELQPERWAERIERYGDVASRVTVTHDLDLTLGFMGSMVETAAPLIGGITEAEWRNLLGRFETPEVGWPALGIKGLRSIIKHRPDRWLKTVRYAPGDLADARLSDWQLHLGARVELSTTRGGVWPESLTFAKGSPGTPWNQVVEDVSARFASGDPDRLARVQGLIDSGAEVPVASIVEGLLY